MLSAPMYKSKRAQTSSALSTLGWLKAAISASANSSAKFQDVALVYSGEAAKLQTLNVSLWEAETTSKGIMCLINCFVLVVVALRQRRVDMV